MKAIALISALALGTSTLAAQSRPVTFGVSVGTAIAMSQPASTPFEAHVTGWYNVSPRFMAGAGTGVACYEKTLIPVYGDLRFLLTRPRRITPYIACAAGYAFAASCDANGGLYLNPNIGMQWAVRNRIRLFFAAGYQIQRLERLKTQTGSWFSSAFHEQLQHHAISLRIGVLF